MDSNKISFSQAILATASLNIDELHGYQAKTLRKDNQARINYLALFPTIFSNRTEELLLANVPGLYFQYTYLCHVSCFVSSLIIF